MNSPPGSRAATNSSWAGRIAIAAGGAVLNAMLIGVIQFNPSVAGIAAAVLSGYPTAMANTRIFPSLAGRAI
jgi:hypothetical protein